MGLKLYMTWGSPPVNAVLMTAKALKVELDLYEMDLSKQENLSDWYLKINPSHTIPALDDDGFIVWDSHAILMYLLETYGKDTNFYPKNPKENFKILQVLNLDCGTIFRRLSECLRPIFYENQNRIASKTLEIAKESYTTLERILSQEKFVAGGNLTIADISIFASIIAQNIFLPISSDEFPSLKKWFLHLQSLDLYEAGVKGEETLKTGLKLKLDNF